MRKEFNSSNVYFTGCTHFGHPNILKYDKRPFNNIQEHDNAIINNINSVVKNEDTIFFLGDFTFLRDLEKIKDIILKINGTKHFIIGNHDKELENNKVLQKLFNTFEYYDEIIIKSQLIILSHYPFNAWNGESRGSWMLHSHIHNNRNENYRNDYKTLDVGIMNNNWTPFSFNQINKIMSTKKVVTY